MTQCLVEGIIYWINYFPSKVGVFRTMRPATIVQGIPNAYNSKERIIFEAYAMLYTKNTHTHTKYQGELLILQFASIMIMEAIISCSYIQERKFTAASCMRCL